MNERFYLEGDELRQGRRWPQVSQRAPSGKAAAVRGGAGHFCGRVRAMLTSHTERLRLSLVQSSAPVCGEYPSPVVSRAIFPFLCLFYETTTYLMPGAYFRPGAALITLYTSTLLFFLRLRERGAL